MKTNLSMQYLRKIFSITLSDSFLFKIILTIIKRVAQLNPLSPKMTFFHHVFQRLYFLIIKVVMNFQITVFDVKSTDLSESGIHFFEKCTCDDLFRL